MDQAPFPGRDGDAAASLPTPAPPPPAGVPAFAAGADAVRLDSRLRGALLESRQRWRDFVTLAADLVFETDADGLLTFLAPDQLLGRPAETLLHRPARDLLVPGGADPFALRAATNGMRAWMRRPDGQAACFSFNVAPLTDALGRFAGLRGIARDVTIEEAAAEAQAMMLRRAGALEVLVRRVRQEVLAPRMLAATLESLPPVLGCAGAVVLEFPPGQPPMVVLRHGDEPGPLLAAAQALDGPVAAFGPGPGGEHLALIPQPVRGEPRHALLAWRLPSARGFDAEERTLMVSLTDLVFVALGNQALQRELELQARTEALTGLLNRRAFLADLRRRLDRHERARPAAGPAGALLFIDLDNFKPINDLLGHEAGDAALIAVANLLRDLVRPLDLVARIGGDEFAIWLEAVDAEAAAGRAEALTWAGANTLPLLLRSGPTALTFSIGCAPSLPGLVETPEQLIARADAAMYEAKRAGRNCWRLDSQPAPEPAPMPVTEPPPR
jgi:diguanylate cyclase (GGDEF)-like protein